jgi:hypothetical protein
VSTNKADILPLVRLLIKKAVMLKAQRIGFPRH